MFNHLAPSGTPISLADLTRWFWNLLKQENSVDTFKNGLKRRFGMKHCFTFSTGRTGMAFLLKALYELDDKKRNEVIIPSYTCYSVPASVEYAGLKVRILDIDTNTLDYNYSEMEKAGFENVLAIVSSNLYGIPNKLDRMEEIARKNDIFMIDDAAQSMGAMLAGRYAGTFGDAGLFSLDKGKNITSLEGGIIVTNSDTIAEKLKEYADQFPTPTFIQNCVYILKVVFYSIFLHPLLYWIPNRLPFLHLGKTRYEAQMPLFSFNNLHAALAGVMLKKLDTITDTRIRNAHRLMDKLEDQNEFMVPNPPEGSEPVYLRLPLIINDDKRDQLIRALNRAGIGASGSYPRSVFEVDEVRRIMNAGMSTAASGIAVSRSIVTLPTHPYLTRRRIHKIRKVFDEILN